MAHMTRRRNVDSLVEAEVGSRGWEKISDVVDWRKHIAKSCSRTTHDGYQALQIPRIARRTASAAGREPVLPSSDDRGGTLRS